MDPADLERLIDRELQQLPAPHAPRTLLPRVMAAVEQSERRWYTRAWFAWPAGWQIASVLLLVAIVAGGMVLLPIVQSAVDALSFVGDFRGDVEETARDVAGATTAVRVLWRTLFAPVVPYAFGLVLLMCAACAVFGTALNHLVFGKALR